MKVVEAVKNCGIEGLYAFWMDDDSIIYGAKAWTTLAANDFGDALPFATHQLDFDRRIIVGELEEIRVSDPIVAPNSDRVNPYNYRSWHWDGERYTPYESRVQMSDETRHRILTPNTSPVFVPKFDLQTVRQLSKVVAWIATPRQSDKVYQQTVWSRKDLTNWHLENDWFKELSTKEANKAFNFFRRKDLGCTVLS